VADRSVRLEGDDLEFLRETVMTAVLAPALDIAASSAAGSQAATDARRAAGLLSRIGWPGDETSAVEIAREDLAEARRALLVLIAGTTEAVWESVTAALDADEECGAVCDALAEHERAGRLLRALEPVMQSPAAPAERASGAISAGRPEHRRSRVPRGARRRRASACSWTSAV
jgi:hypothetical protein